VAERRRHTGHVSTIKGDNGSARRVQNRKYG